MSINFKLEYNPKSQEIRIINYTSDFNWIPASYIDPFNNPTFKLGENYGTWMIKISRDRKTLIIRGEWQDNNYTSFTNIYSHSETFLFSNFKKRILNEDGKWITVKEINLDNQN